MKYYIIVGSLVLLFSIHLENEGFWMINYFLDSIKDEGGSDGTFPLKTKQNTERQTCWASWAELGQAQLKLGLGFTSTIDS